MITDFTKKNGSLQRLIDFCVSPDSGANCSYDELREILTKFFRLKGDGEPESAADAVLDRVAEKMSEGVEIENLRKYSIAVARFVFLERLRQTKREYDAAGEFYANQNYSPTDPAQPDERLAIWRECFQNLEAEDQNLLKRYFAELSFSELNARRLEICAEQNISLNNLRLKVFRLRQRLDKCVAGKLK